MTATIISDDVAKSHHQRSTLNVLDDFFRCVILTIGRVTHRIRDALISGRSYDENEYVSHVVIFIRWVTIIA